MGKSPRQISFEVLPGLFAVCRLPADAPIPDWAQFGLLTSVTRTADELSIVCPIENVPDEQRPGPRWICLKLQGPFAFSETGILSSFIDPLANAGIGIFAMSTYDTDYVLIQQQDSEKTLKTLAEAGHELLHG
jgi:hypothetical protein